MKYVSIDIETTGLNWNHCDVIEVGAVVDDLHNRLPLDELPRFHCYVVREYYKGDPYALAMHKDIFLRIAKREKPYLYLRPGNVADHLYQFLKNTFNPQTEGDYSLNAAGKNFSGFDTNFLDRLEDFGREGSGLIINRPTSHNPFKLRQRVTDMGNLYFDWKIDNKLPDTKTCMERAGINQELTHTAIDDCLLIVELFRRKCQ